MTVSYLKSTMAFSAMYATFDITKDYMPFLMVVVYPFGVCATLYKFRAHLSEPSAKSKIGSMYEGINIKGHKQNVFHYPIFLFRRLIFVQIPIFLVNDYF